MKKNVILVVSVLLISALSLSAQPSRDVKKGRSEVVTPKERAEHMAKELDLTDKQKGEVQALFEKQATQQKEKREKVKKERTEKAEIQKNEFETARKAQNAELEKIIGKEKFQQWEDTRAKRQEKRHGEKKKKS